MPTSKPANKDYLAIAKRRVTRPSKQESYRRVLAYARNKKGKTRFGLSGGVEQTLVLDPENGTDTMKAMDPYVWHVTRWEDMNEAWGALRTGELSPALLGLGKSTTPFSILSVDGTTRMNNMALHYVRGQAELKDLDRKPGMIDRRDYNKSGELMKQMMLNFHTLPMHVVYTAQERAITVENEDITDELNAEKAYYVADLPQGVRGTINAIVEVIGRLYVARITVKLKGGGTAERMQRRLWIGLHEQYDTGYRSDFVLPDYIKNPTLPQLTSLMLAGTEKGTP
jgi:hypothetical protein